MNKVCKFIKTLVQCFAYIFGVLVSLILIVIGVFWYVISIPYGEPASDAEMIAFLEEHRSELNILAAAVDGDHVPLPVIENPWYAAEEGDAELEYPAFYAAYNYFTELEQDGDVYSVGFGKNGISIRLGPPSEWEYPMHIKYLIYESDETDLEGMVFTEMDTNEYMATEAWLQDDEVKIFTIYRSLGNGWYIRHEMDKLIPYE